MCSWLIKNVTIYWIFDKLYLSFWGIIIIFLSYIFANLWFIIWFNTWVTIIWFFFYTLFWILFHKPYGNHVICREWFARLSYSYKDPEARRKEVSTKRRGAELLDHTGEGLSWQRKGRTVRRARLKGEGRSCSTIRERDFPDKGREGITSPLWLAHHASVKAHPIGWE